VANQSSLPPPISSAEFNTLTMSSIKIANKDIILNKIYPNPQLKTEQRRSEIERI